MPVMRYSVSRNGTVSQDRLNLAAREASLRVVIQVYPGGKAECYFAKELDGERADSVLRLIDKFRAAVPSALRFYGVKSGKALVLENNGFFSASCSPLEPGTLGEIAAALGVSEISEQTGGIPRRLWPGFQDKKA
jgi:hypothetical protein